MIVFAFVLTPCVCAVRWICGRVPAWKGTGETSATSSTRSRRSSSPASQTPACLAQALHPARGPHPRRTSPEQLLPAPRLQPRLIGPVARLLERDMKATLAAIDAASVPYDDCVDTMVAAMGRRGWRVNTVGMLTACLGPHGETVGWAGETLVCSVGWAKQGKQQTRMRRARKRVWRIPRLAGHAACPCAWSLRHRVWRIPRLAQGSIRSNRAAHLQ